jgi:hypothetical protein
MTAEHWEEIQRRMADDDGTRYTWDEVKEHLRTAKRPDPDVALALQRMEDAKNGGRFYTTKEVIDRLQAPE